MPARHQEPTYLEQMDTIPPRICFLVARKNRRALTQADIMQATGWGKEKVSKMCGLESFREVTVEDADKFRIVCGVSRRQERRTRFYLRRSLDLEQTTNSLNHLRKRGVRVPKFIRELSSKNP